MATTFVSLRKFTEDCELFIGSLTNKTTKETFPCIKVVNPVEDSCYIFFAKSLPTMTAAQIKKEADSLQVAIVNKVDEATNKVVSTTYFLCKANSSWKRFTL